MCDNATVSFGQFAVCGRFPDSQLGTFAYAGAPVIGGELVRAVPFSGCADLQNAAQMAGKVVVMRGVVACEDMSCYGLAESGDFTFVCTTLDKARRAQAAGALAVLLLGQMVYTTNLPMISIPILTVPIAAARSLDLSQGLWATVRPGATSAGVAWLDSRYMRRFADRRECGSSDVHADSAQWGSVDRTDDQAGPHLLSAWGDGGRGSRSSSRTHLGPHFFCAGAMPRKNVSVDGVYNIFSVCAAEQCADTSSVGVTDICADTCSVGVTDICTIHTHPFDAANVHAHRAERIPDRRTVHSPGASHDRTYDRDPGFGTVEMRSSAHQSSRPRYTGRQRFGSDAAQLGGSNCSTEHPGTDGSTEHPGTDGPSNLKSADVTGSEGSMYTSPVPPSARRRRAGYCRASLSLACDAVCSTRAHARRLADAIESVSFQTTRSDMNWTWSCAEPPLIQDPYTQYGCGAPGTCASNCDGPYDRECKMVFSRAFDVADSCEFARDGACDGPLPQGSNRVTSDHCVVGDYEDCGTQDVWEGVELKGPLPAIDSLTCFQDLRIMYACFSWASFAHYSACLRSIAWLQQLTTQFSHWGTACKFSRLHQQVTEAVDPVSHPLLRCIGAKWLPLSLLCSAGIFARTSSSAKWQ